MKKRNVLTISGLLTMILFAACSKDDKKVDTDAPSIDITVAGAFPQQCSEVKRGETFTFKAQFKDNIRLGSFSLDIHHNFDHHSHSTEVNSCTMEPVKAPVQPLLYIKSFPIPEGSTYDANVKIAVPADIDPGDYHFMIMLTDAEGWQTIKGLSIKVK